MGTFLGFQRPLTFSKGTISVIYFLCVKMHNPYYSNRCPASSKYGFIRERILLLMHACSGSVLKPFGGMRHCLLDLPDDSGDHRDSVLQETRIGRVMNVRFHHRGVRPKLAVLEEFFFLQLLNEGLIQLTDGFLSVAFAGLDQGRGIRHFLIQVDSAEPPPGQTVLYFPNQGFIAQLVAKLQVHQPKVGFHRNGGTSRFGVKSLDKGLQKALVIQQLIHLLQLGRQRTKRFRQDRIPKCQLVLPQIQHFHHPARICRGGSRISLIKEFSPCGLLCGWVWLGHLTVSTKGAEFLSF